jgi:quercetin dioxygenase-like cupin family protein
MTFRIPARAAVAAGLGALFVVSSLWTARAQTPAPQSAPTASNFTGKSETLDTKGLSLSRRSFEPAARANWHVHDSGQLLFAQQGRMRVQVEGQKMRELAEGESIYLAPAVAHWHGAAPGVPLQQVSVTFAAGIKWMEPVTDGQYAGTAARAK